MKKHIFIAFLSIALFQGFLFSEVDSVPDSNTSQSSISDTYQEEDVLISFNGAYRGTEYDYAEHSNTDYYNVELKVKSLADNKIIQPERFYSVVESYGVQLWNNYNSGVQVLDNFGNDLGFKRISPDKYNDKEGWQEKGLRPREEKLFTIKFRIKPLENTEYLLLKIPRKTFGNVNPFELKIVNFHSIPDSLKKKQQEIAVREANERLLAEREANKRLEAYKKGRLIVIVASVVSPLVVVICITWLLVKVKRIRQFIVSHRTQIIIWIGILLIVLMCLFPPSRSYSEYNFLFSEHGVIDVVQLGLQCSLVALVISGLIYTFRGKKRD